jgi:hypothetical protein
VQIAVNYSDVGFFVAATLVTALSQIRCSLIGSITDCLWLLRFIRGNPKIGFRTPITQLFSP